MLEGVGVVDQLGQQLVVAGPGQLEALADRGVLGSGLRPPAPLEVEDRPVTLGECHPDQAGLRAHLDQGIQGGGRRQCPEQGAWHVPPRRLRLARGHHAGFEAHVGVDGEQDRRAQLARGRRTRRRLHHLAVGRYRIVVRDRSRAHNFHARGFGINRKTGVQARRTYTWNVTLKRGTLRFYSDASPRRLRGSVPVG